MVDGEFLHLLKYGRADELQARIKTEQKKEYSSSFVSFMDEMIEEYKVKRKDIAIRSGMSQDYIYKLLRGDKKTTERDYIIAMCIAIGMNLGQIQHALKIYGMPILNRRDLRSQVIILGIEDGRDIDGINSFLEKAKFPYIKTSPDMPSAEIKIISSDEDDETTVCVDNKLFVQEYKELDRDVFAEHCGCAPMDYSYSGQIRLQAEDGNVYRVYATFGPMGSYFFTDIEKEDNNVSDEEEDFDPIEQYEDLIDAANSPFFKYYLDLDKATDEKVAETMAMVDDTKNYGMRAGCHYASQLRGYLEVYNTKMPELQEYMQVIRTNDGYTYTITHESIFMRIELGDLYPVYFGNLRSEPVYLVQANSPEEAGKKNATYKFFFTELKNELNIILKEKFGNPFGDAEETGDCSDIELYAQRAAIATRSDDHETALRNNMKAYDISTSPENDAKVSLDIKVITAWKIAQNYMSLGNGEEWLRWMETIISYAPLVEEMFGTEELRSAAKNAAGPIADAYRSLFLRDYQAGRKAEAKIKAETALHWYDLSDINAHNAYVYVNTLAMYAFIIDEEDPEKAASYTEKALRVIRRYKLYNTPDDVKLANMVYRNHAWVLWNRLGREEAIIYYGQLIDILENALLENSSKEIVDSLFNAYHSLSEIYEATGKENEMKRLQDRKVEFLSNFADNTKN